MSPSSRTLVFVAFFVSGFCGLLYQVVWVRLAYAAFGVITPVLSVVISVFMLGLAIGSWLGGRFIARGEGRRRLSPAISYGIAEAVIGAGAFAVPALFTLGERMLRGAGALSSVSYLACSAAVLALAVVPFCTAMGVTFPFMMAFLRERGFAGTASFSYLYLANVIGATLGAVTTAFVLIEELGFARTLVLAAVLNGGVAVLACVLASQQRGDAPAPPAEPASAPLAPLPAWFAYVVLFGTGFVSMALEVAWVRHFSYYIGTLTYSFAALLGTYLLATGVGSFVYRGHLAMGRVARVEAVLGVVACAALLPIVFTDNRTAPDFATILPSVFPLCAALGYLTPQIVDRFAAGDPARAGRAYAVNVIGCILGPLCACYVLLPWLDGKRCMLLLAGVLTLFFVLRMGVRVLASGLGLGTAAVLATLTAWALARNYSFEEAVLVIAPRSEIRHDYAGTVIAADPTGEMRARRLYVNGVEITTLTTITKIMAHLPLAYLGRKPASAIVICFGMGTTFRSLMSWGVDTTAVDLAPGVLAAFPFFHADAAALRASPNGHCIVDDGRRFLARTDRRFDVITIDPPPPVEAAGSSLLYSVEFCRLAKSRLSEGGILHQWVPDGGTPAERAIARALTDVFPHVLVYKSVEGWGHHFICASHPLTPLSAAQLVERMPEAARRDLLEWEPAQKIEEFAARIVGLAMPVEQLLQPASNARVTDDRPFNEYYLVRAARARWRERK